MSKDTKSALTGFVLSVFVVVAFCLCGLFIQAAFAGGPPKEVLAEAAAIKANQEAIAETREAHEKFVQAKRDNEARVGRMEEQGWSINWQTLEPVPASVAPDYKTKRLQEMANMWKGTVLEPHTVMLLSMLIQEDGTLTAERRHDCIKGVCYAIGFMGHHICHRGTPLIYRGWGTTDPATGIDHGPKYYCGWKGGKSPQKQFEEDYPDFATNWHVQFQEYTLRMTDCIASGKTVNSCIQAWNSKEVGRIGKVKKHNDFVSDSLLTSL